MVQGQRIFTTHVGSLPRPQSVVDQVFAEDRGEPVDHDVFERVIGEGVAEVVRKQAEAGVDFVSDGEMSKIGYATYIRHRLSGFELGEVPRATPADLDAYPRFRDRQAAEGTAPKYKRPICRGPIAYVNTELMKTDFAHLKNALKGVNVAGAFMNAPSPGVMALFQPNEYYKTREEYLYALGEAMKTEYEAIVAAGFDLQLDCPDLAMAAHTGFQSLSEAEFTARAWQNVEALNAATRNIPSEKLRMHVCWGNYEGPHHCDIALEKVIDPILAARPSTILFEAANPRHEHEWEIWRDAKLADNKILAPGLIDSCSNYVEHPELIRQRLERYVAFMGKDRVLASTDCGFGTFANYGKIDPAVTWMKLAVLRDGAERAAHAAG